MFAAPVVGQILVDCQDIVTAGTGVLVFLGSYVIAYQIMKRA